ncbi:TPA: hypothetical protein ACRX0P_000110 [Klebsiella pneumoniae]
MSHPPHFPLFAYDLREGLAELNRQLELAQSEKQSVTERDLLNLEGGITYEFPSGEPLFYISLGEHTGEPIYSSLRRCGEELGFTINSCVSICSIRGSELVKAFNLFFVPASAGSLAKGKVHTTSAQARFMVSLLKALRYTDEDLRGSTSALMMKLAADGIDVSVTEKPFREWLEKGGAR